MPKPTHLDRVLDWLKNHPALAWLVVVGGVIIWIGNIAASINNVKALWFDDTEQIAAGNCKYLLVNPLTIPDAADSLTLSLGSDSVDLDGAMSGLTDMLKVNTRRVVTLKDLDEGTYKFRVAYSVIDPSQPAWRDPRGVEHPGRRLNSFEYVFRIDGRDYYEVVRDAQSKAGFRVDAIADEDVPVKITRGRFVIPDCRYVGDGIGWG